LLLRVRVAVRLTGGVFCFLFLSLSVTVEDLMVKPKITAKIKTGMNH
jgi:hypothetical protein